jgi:mannose-1-phosphate guanylyltransferase
VFADSKIGQSSCIDGSIVGWECKIGKWVSPIPGSCRETSLTRLLQVRLDQDCVLGKDVGVEDTIHLNGVKVLPHKSVKESMLESRVIM